MKSDSLLSRLPLIGSPAPGAGKALHRALRATALISPIAMTFALLGCVSADSGEDVIDDVDALATSNIEEGDYVLKTAINGKCVDIYAASKDNGAAVQEFDCNGSGAQLFHIKAVGDGYHTISSVNSGKYLSVAYASSNPAVELIQWDFQDIDTQKFKFSALGDDTFGIFVKKTQFAVDVRSSGTANGTVIQQYPWNETRAQRWTLTRVGGTTPPPVTDPPPVTNPPGGTTIPAGRGAAVPWTEYQAEDGTTNARVIGPSRARYDAAAIEAEAIGRKAVRLERTGDFVAIRTTKAANSIVVRVSIPDSPGGGGIDSTLSLYVNGTRVRSLPVTSRYSWVYGGEDINTPNEPGRGQPHAFFDETRALLDQIPAGAEVKLQKDGGDGAAFYVVDLIDLEQVGAPLEKPADLVSITEFGATPDDNTDDGVAIQNAIDSAVGLHKAGLWIPRGTFLVNQVKQGQLGLSMKGIQMRGAGMWYSSLKGAKASIFCWGEGGCNYSNFSILGEANRRDDTVPNNGFNGGVGRGSSIDSVWVEHVKVGFWCGTDGDAFGTDGLIVKNSRFRNIYADGINFANGTRNSVVENSHFRNTGDDAMAMWSYRNSGDGPDHDNVFRHNTVQMPWRANCFAIYGGYNNTIEDSVCEDVLTYAGVLVSNDFQPHAFGPTTTLKNLSLIRAGGPMFNADHGALWFLTAQGPVSDVNASNIDIIDSTFSGIQFEGGAGARMSNIKLSNINVTGSGTFGIEARSGADGQVTFEGVVVKNAAQGGLSAQGVPGSFFNRLGGNQGW